jgi:hypothetical protein
LSRDQKFFDMYSLVIGVLAAFALGILVLAMKMSDLTQGVYTRDTAEYQAAVAERIRPLGQVYLPGEEQQAGAPVAKTVPELVGDVAAWTARIAQGSDLLYDHAINGFQGDAPTPMLPKGGRVDLSDQEVRDAVDYMVSESQ